MIYLLIWTVFEVGTPHPYVELEDEVFSTMSGCSDKLVQLTDAMDGIGEGQCIAISVKRACK